MKRSRIKVDSDGKRKYIFAFAIVVALKLSFVGGAQAQCWGFNFLVQTDPPFLQYCPNDTILAFPVIENGTWPFTYQWSTGGTDSIEQLVALENGWFSACVTVTDSLGCTGTACVHIKATFWDIIAVTDGIACEGSPVGLYVAVDPNENTFVWSTGETADYIVVTEPGTYTVTVTNIAYGCVQAVDVEVEFTPAPTPEIVGPAGLCTGQTATLTVDSAWLYDNFIWSPVGWTESIEISGPGTYAVTVYNDDDLCQGSDTIVVEPLPGISPDLSAPPQLCPEDEGIVEVTNAGDFTSFLWNTGGTNSSIVNAGPGTYAVTVTDLNGCVATGEIDISAFEVIVPAILGDNELCVSQQSVVLTVDPSFTLYVWSTGETSASIVVDQPDTYSVTVTDANGCTSIGVHELVAAPIPEPFIPAPPLSCDNNPVTLSVEGTGGPYITFEWSNGETGSEVIVNETGTYSVTVTNAFGCTAATDEETVIIGLGPTAEIIEIPGSCDGTVTLVASGGGDYTWSTGDTGSSIIVSNDGAFSVTVTDENGCTDTAYLDVVIPPDPEVEVTGPSEICDGGTGYLNATTGFTDYIWTGGELTSEIQIFQPGTYSVTVTDENGCTATDSYMVSTAPPPEPSITGPAGFCNGESATLELNEAFFEILWSTGETTQNITVAEASTYSVLVTNSSGCTGTDEWAVSEFLAPVVDITGPSSICLGGSATLAVSGSYSEIVWSTGETTSSIMTSLSGIYEVVVTDINGCTASDQHMLEVGDSLTPVIAVIGPGCDGAATLDVGIGYTSYLWSNDSTTSSITVTAEGTYTVTVSDASGCSGQDDAIVTLPAPPQVDITGPTAACEGNAGTLIASPGFVTYAWSGGDTTESITVTQSGIYSVLVTDGNGCTATASQAFESFPMPTVDIVGPGTFCTGSSANLTVAGSYSEIVWSTGETTPGIVISQSGTYGVFVTDSNGCSASDTFAVQTADALSPLIVVSGPLCDGTATLNAGTGYGTYLWSNGATTTEITVMTSGIYSVTVSDVSGCSGEDTASITILDPPQVSITGPSAACEDSPGTLVASPGFSLYAWSTGETTESISVSQSGNYTVVVTDISGCTATASQSFEAFPLPVVEISGPGFICHGTITTLFASGDYSEIIWSTGATTSSIDISQGGLYSVLVTDSNGCAATNDFPVTPLHTDSTYLLIETCTAQDTGTIEFIMVNQSGCDSIVTISTVLASSLTSTVSLSACPGEYVQFDGVQIAAGTSQQFVYLTPDGCDSLVTVTVSELPRVDFDVSATTTCPGKFEGVISVSLHEGTAPCLFTLNGSNSQPDSVFPGLPGGIHTVQVSDANGCSLEQTIEIHESVPVVLEVEDQELSCDENTVVLQPTVVTGNLSEITWKWSNGSTESWMLADRPGNYVVQVDDGCAVQEYTIRVDRSQDLQGRDVFFIPNVFSPNGDGINDEFQVLSGLDHTLLSFEFRIFDRWGNLMFGTTDIDEGWDGIFRGIQMQPGVYVWYIKARVELCDMRTLDIVKKGDLTILR